MAVKFFTRLSNKVLVTWPEDWTLCHSAALQNKGELSQCMDFREQSYYKYISLM